jgi:outer membrane protein OmpA-like peptidoglycan-associated protein
VERSVSFALFFSVATLAVAQRSLELRAEGDPATVLVRGFTGSDDIQPALQAFWRFPADTPITFSYQQLSAPSGERSLMLRQLLLAGIEHYFDQRVHFEKKGVKADVSDERMLLDLNAMVAAAAHEFKVSEGFSGFTEPTMEQLERLTHIDWSQATFTAGTGDEQDKYLAIYYFVRSQRQELFRQLRADLLPLAGVELLTTDQVVTAFATGRSVQVPTVCSTVYDDQNFLCALDLGVSDTTSAFSDSQLTDDLMVRLAREARRTIAEEGPAEELPQNKVRKRDRWLKAELDRINERIDELDQRKELWKLRDRMDDMESRIDDIGMEVNEIRATATVPSDNPIANLSDLVGKNVVVRFPRNSSDLEATYRVMLNEVFEQLARMPNDRVLITGYTDRSGDPQVNLVLSELRANAVRSYLLARGIAGERLLVNYYGDSRSSGRDPSERRVEVEWLR